MPPVTNQSLGHAGEDLAAAAYVTLGYEVVARRWRVAVGELDLVLRRDDVLVFCEVKTRRGDRCGRPEESVGRRRLVRLRETARRFLAEHAFRGVREYRFDVAAVTVRPRRRTVAVEIIEGVC